MKWKVDTMKKYAMYARETEKCPKGHISFTHWRNANDVAKEERPALLQKASNNK